MPTGTMTSFVGVGTEKKECYRYCQPCGKNVYYQPEEINNYSEYQPFILKIMHLASVSVEYAMATLVLGTLVPSA